MVAAGLMAGTFAFAQDAPKKDEGKFTVSGYIDSYYLTAFNRPQSGQLTGAYAGRAFDRLTDQFALGLAQTRFAYSNDKSEMVIDLTFGPNAELGNFGNHSTYVGGYYPSLGPKNGLYGSSAAIKQAYFTYKFTDKLSFTVGQFGTHIGYEVIDAPVNFHYSLSNLFNNGPFYHVGGKLNYAISDKMGVMAGVVNNWDALMDWKKSKSVIAQYYISPIDGWNVYLNFIGGANDDGFRVNPTLVEPSPNYPNAVTVDTDGDGVDDASIGLGGYTRIMFDLTTGYQINDKFYIGLNAAYGMYSFSTEDAVSKAIIEGLYGSTSPNWYGVALYPNYKINDMFSIGARIEYFNDENGVRYFGYVADPNKTKGVLGASNTAFTLTAPITLADGHVIIKPELRIDNASLDYYEKKDGTLGKSQQTLGMAFIYKY